MRTIIHYQDDEQLLVKVPLDDEGTKHAIVDDVIFQDLMSLGMSPIWSNRIDRGRDKVVYWNKSIQRHTAVSRVIMGARRKQSVVHVNGDSLDLRTSNLCLGPGKGLRHDKS